MKKTRYTTQEVHGWSALETASVGAEIHSFHGEEPLTVVLLEPEGSRSVPVHGIPAPHFRVTKPDLERICRQILREIAPTPQDEILSTLREILLQIRQEET